jgi:hypothetical protein
VLEAGTPLATTPAVATQDAQVNANKATASFLFTFFIVFSPYL